MCLRAAAFLELSMLTRYYLVAITSRNAGSVRTRTVGSALYNMTVQAGSIISSNVSNLRFEVLSPEHSC